MSKAHDILINNAKNDGDNDNNSNNDEFESK